MPEKVKPIKPDGYADHLSGNWDDVPEWAINRINFLEETMEWYDKSRCPEWDNSCPNVPDHVGTMKFGYLIKINNS
jgi:hypothetical protein